MRIGAHISIDRGLSQAIDHAVAIGAECLQMFISPPQAWRSPSHGAEAIASFKARRRETGVSPIFLHSVYLINLVSSAEDLRERSLRSLITYLDWAERLEVDGVITHLGSARDVGPEEAARMLPEALARALATAEGKVPLLLETTAGPGAVLGSTFAELGEAITAAGGSPRLHVCLDTAHVFASGLYDGTPEGLDLMLAELDRAVGLERLSAVHLNDSKSAFGSRVDRHANIGQGQLGEAGLRPVLRHPALRHLPFLLEVPGVDREGPGRADIAAARALAFGEELPI
ncbi:MAG: deoxyribonuclease IV [Chloroflexota bacterium]